MKEVVHTSPTIGSNVEEIVVKNTHFLMWDIGGQESLRASWNTYYSNTEFIILVVDSTDRERLAISKEELYRMLAHEVRNCLHHAHMCFPSCCPAHCPETACAKQNVPPFNLYHPPLPLFNLVWLKKQKLAQLSQKFQLLK
uniref:ADP-ribosylation factor-like 5C n=1 Tax=Electrophorus electricus TaxID=8005 RepID=A0A4W4DTQ1_ELEEL